MRSISRHPEFRIMDSLLNSVMLVFSGRHGQHLAMSVGRSVRPSRNIFEFRAFFALLLLPNHLRLDCCVSGLILSIFCSGHKAP